MNLEKRIKRIEELVGIKQEEPPVFIIRLEYGNAAPRFAEPVEEWLTFKESLEEARQARRCAGVFEVNPYREYEARHGLPAGTLAKHELRGKVPFEQLLALTMAKQGNYGATLMNLAARVDKLEKAMGVGQSQTVLFIVESVHTAPDMVRDGPALPERVADWITAQPQLAAQKDQTLATIYVCPELERAAQAKAQGIRYEIDESRVVRPAGVPVVEA